MIAVICWLVVHTSNDKLDNRTYLQHNGTVLSEANDSKGDLLKVLFYDDFMQKKVDLTFNPTVQLVRDSECSYGE